MDIFLIRLLQFMLAIGLLVLLHEGGHFFFAKLFGISNENSLRGKGENCMDSQAVF